MFRLDPEKRACLSTLHRTYSFLQVFKGNSFSGYMWYVLVQLIHMEGASWMVQFSGRVAEVGALSMADEGVCCIDELGAESLSREGVCFVQVFRDSSQSLISSKPIPQVSQNIYVLECPDVGAFGPPLTGSTKCC